MAATCLLLALCITAAKADAGRMMGLSPVGPAATPDTVVPGAIPAILGLLATLPRVLAVVIVHASTSLPEGSEPDYVAALKPGMATLVIDIWTPRGIPYAHRVL